MNDMTSNQISRRDPAFDRIARYAILSALAAFLVSPAAADGFLEGRLPLTQNHSAFVSQDPLMQQILLRQVTEKDGGVKSVVRIATGEVIELKVVDLHAQPISGKNPAILSTSAGDHGLSIHPGLLPKKEKKGTQAKARKADKQLKLLKRQGKDSSWNRKSDPLPTPPKKSVRRTRGSR